MKPPHAPPQPRRLPQPVRRPAPVPRPRPRLRVPPPAAPPPPPPSSPAPPRQCRTSSPLRRAGPAAGRHGPRGGWDEGAQGRDQAQVPPPADAACPAPAEGKAKLWRAPALLPPKAWAKPAPSAGPARSRQAGLRRPCPGNQAAALGGSATAAAPGSQHRAGPAPPVGHREGPAREAYAPHSLEA